jgi:hypothetical protein
LAASSALLASVHFEVPVGPINSQACQALTSQGDHILAEQKRIAEEAGEVPPILARIPAHFKRSLALAYSHVHLLDDQALVLSYLNGTSPLDYPDDQKIDQTMLLLPGFDLINYERDRASSELAHMWARANGIL